MNIDNDGETRHMTLTGCQRVELMMCRGRFLVILWSIRGRIVICLLNLWIIRHDAKLCFYKLWYPHVSCGYGFDLKPDWLMAKIWLTVIRFSTKTCQYLTIMMPNLWQLFLSMFW